MQSYASTVRMKLSRKHAQRHACLWAMGECKSAESTGVVWWVVGRCAVGVSKRCVVSHLEVPYLWLCPCHLQPTCFLRHPARSQFRAAARGELQPSHHSLHHSRRNRSAWHGSCTCTPHHRSSESVAAHRNHSHLDFLSCSRNLRCKGLLELPTSHHQRCVGCAVGACCCCTVGSTIVLPLRWWWWLPP
jgi:hypothetical protein